MNRGRIISISAASGLLVLGTLAAGQAVMAYPGGISGVSTTGCGCHSGGVAPSVSIIGPTSVAPGSTNTYRLTISGGQKVNGGLDVSATAGTLASISGQGTTLMSGEITHSSPKSADAQGNVAFDFTWTAPASGSAKISGAGLSGNGNGGTSGDNYNTVSITVNVASAYTITASAGAGGAISPSGAVAVNSGASQTFTITPNTGYHTASVAVDSAAQSPIPASYTFANVVTNHTISAAFAINIYTLTYTAGTGGTISGTATQTVNYGSSGTQVTAVANTGYHFVNWSDGVATAARTDTGVTANKSITANFAINTYTLAYTAGAGGTISGTATQTVNYGSSGTQVTAVANTGYHFVNWSDGVATAARTDTSVAANKSVTANFAINTYTLAYTAGAGGTISGTAAQTVNYGTSGTQVTAVANTGYHFVSWSDGVVTASRTDTNITSNKSVTANFAADAVVSYNITASAGSGGSISPSGVVAVNSGASQAFTVTPDAGYHVVSVAMDGVAQSLVLTSYTFTNVVTNHTISATFAINTYTLTYTAGTGGTVSGTATQTVNYGASGTQVTAVANTGYHFVNWSDGVAIAARTDTNVMANKNVTANFAADTVGSTYTITASAGIGGSISPSGVTTVNSGDSITFRISDNTGYHIEDVLVDGHSVGPVSSYTFKDVTGNHTITVVFNHGNKNKNGNGGHND